MSTSMKVPGPVVRRGVRAGATPRGRENLLPANTSVISSLSEDTIMAQAMMIASGENTTALFANPLRDEREELLFVDVTGALMWLTHSNDSDEGWQTVKLQSQASEVVVAVHPDQSVWAFAIDRDGQIHAWRLQDAGGALSWEPAELDMPAPSNPRRLRVQYMADRPSTVNVLWVGDDTGSTTCALGALTSQPRLQYEVRAGSWDFNPLLARLPAALFAPQAAVFYGCDDPGHRSTRVYSRDASGTLQMVVGNVNSHTGRAIGGCDELAGVWNSRSGLGTVAIRHAPEPGAPDLHEIITVWPDAGLDVHSQMSDLDSELVDTVTWQDANARLYLFGTVGGSLCVVHQVDLVRDAATGVLLPVWDSHDVTRDGVTVPVAIARPLIADVDFFAVDAYPDEYPSQHVMHAGGEAAERCAIYTQDVDSSWWSRQIVHLPVVDVPYKMTRFKSQVTLLDAAGGPVPGYPVTLTSDLPADLEIAGIFYRCGPTRPVTVSTDGAGKIILKVAARSLAGSQLHVTAKGLPNGLAINPAVDAHRFMAGSGTLPNHPQGLTEDGLRHAKTPDGSWLVPGWNGHAHGLAAFPQPSDVMDWCAKVFGAQGGGQVLVAGADGVATPVLALTIQTWDASRPAYEVVTSASRLSELADQRSAHPDYGGLWDDGARWLGDLWQGIGDGIVQIAETAIDLAARTATLVVQWIDDIKLALTIVWDDIVSAAHFVEAVFNSIKAKVLAVIDWLKWLFDFGDIVKTKEALLEGIGRWPAYISKTVDHLVDDIGEGWFVAKENQVRGYVDQVKASVAGIKLAGDRPLPAAVQAKGTDLPPSSVISSSDGLSPHATWMHDQLTTNKAARLNLRERAFVPPEFEAAGKALLDIASVLDDPGVGQEFTKAIEDLGQLFTNLLDFDDPAALARAEFVTFVDLLEQLILLVLQLCDALVHKFATFIKAAVACIPAILATELDEGFIDCLWRFICAESGIDYTTPTMGDVFGLAAAFPTTLLVKAVTGQAPFPDGTFPDFVRVPPADAGPVSEHGPWFPAEDFWGPEKYAVAPVAQLFVQMIVGVATAVYTGVDLYCDAPPVPGDTAGDGSDDVLIALICVFDMLAFGLGDMPLFYGCNNVWEIPKDDPVQGLWWGEYFCKLPYYLGDIVNAWVLPTLLPGRPRNILGKMQDSWGNIIISVLALVEAGFSIALFIGSKHSPLDGIWLASQIISMISSLTAFVRTLPCYDGPMSSRKMLVDGGCDLVSGCWYFVMAAVEWKTSSLGGLPASIPVDVPFSAKLTAGQAGFPPIGWRFEDVSKAPPGLEFTRPQGYADNEVALSGKPTVTGPYEFTIMTVNSYDPNVPVSQTYNLDVV